MNTIKVVCSGCGNELQIVDISAENEYVTSQITVSACSTCLNTADEDARLEERTEAGNSFQRGYEEGKSEGFDEGRDYGHDQGREYGYDQGRNDGYHDGKLDGYDEGKEDGYEQGKREGYDEGHSDGYDEGYENAESQHDNDHI